MVIVGFLKEISGTEATENPNADWPRLTYGNNNMNNRASTFWLRGQEISALEKCGTFLRLFHRLWTRKFLRE